jgi:hypothetical protein
MSARKTPSARYARVIHIISFLRITQTVRLFCIAPLPSSSNPAISIKWVAQWLATAIGGAIVVAAPIATATAVVLALWLAKLAGLR